MGKTLKLSTIFIYLALIVFPFGQIIRMGIIHPLDLIVAGGAMTAFIFNYKKPVIFKYLKLFLFFATFSWVFSIFYFQSSKVLYGLLYLFRLWTYVYFFVYVSNFVDEKKLSRVYLLDSLLLVVTMSGIFGWIQYFSFPSLKPFFEWGWDEHYLRLVGTFLDPTFLGLILVLGIIISIFRFIETKNKKYLLSLVFLTLSVAFTYSRASYLALIAGVVIIGILKNKLKSSIMFIAVLVLLVFALPTSQNLVLKFTRVFSAVNRIENYRETFLIFKKSPLVGIGYNNLCLAKERFTGKSNFGSHACSGSDSSLLYILATTGIFGLIIFVFMIRQIVSNLYKNDTRLMLFSVVAALAVHSLFSNSLVYPWILFCLMCLLGIAKFKEA